MPSRIPFAISVLTVVAAVAVSAGSPALTRAATHAVTISDFAFAPATLTIAVGDTVTWTNEDAIEHTATGAGFDSGLLAQGASFSHTFTAAGTFDYVCTPHPTMTGRIVVVAAAATPAPTAPGTGTPPTGELPDVAMVAPAWSAPVVPIGVALLAAAIVLGVLLNPRVRRRSS